ncbi:hypothetical protein A2U01_0054938, partial [Trifolium medium]|nr:hypothetical protein [Trifolium medium]
DAETQEKLFNLNLLQVSGAGAGAFRSGWSALTTMLILGLNSASYCTHSAATAASCMINDIHCYNRAQNRRSKAHPRVITCVCV